jgi:chromosome segregation ATPase
MSAERDRLAERVRTLEAEQIASTQRHSDALDAASRSHEEFAATTFLPRITELTAAHTQLSARNAELESNMLVLRRELKDARTQLTHAQQQQSDEHLRLEEAESQLRAVSVERDRFADALDAAQRKLQVLAAAAAQRAQDACGTESDAQVRAATLQEQLSSAREELATSQASLRQLQEQHAQLQRTAAATSASAQAAASAAALETEHLRADLARLRTEELASRDQRLQTLEAELHACRDALAQSEALMARSKAEQTALQRRCDTVQAAFALTSAALMDAQAEVDRLRTSLLAKQADKYADEDTIKALQDQLTAAHKHAEATAATDAREVAALRDAHVREIASLADKHADALSAAGGNVATISERHAAALAGANAQLAAAHERHESALVLQSEAHAGQLVSLRDALAAELANLVFVHSSRLEDIERDLTQRNREVESLRQAVRDAKQGSAVLTHGREEADTPRTREDNQTLAHGHLAYGPPHQAAPSASETAAPEQREKEAEENAAAAKDRLSPLPQLLAPASAEQWQLTPAPVYSQQPQFPQLALSPDGDSATVATGVAPPSYACSSVTESVATGFVSGAGSGPTLQSLAAASPIDACLSTPAAPSVLTFASPQPVARVGAVSSGLSLSATPLRSPGSSLGPPSSLSIPAMRAALFALKDAQLDALLNDLPSSARLTHIDLLYKHLPAYAARWPRE